MDVDLTTGATIDNEGGNSDFPKKQMKKIMRDVIEFKRQRYSRSIFDGHSKSD